MQPGATLPEMRFGPVSAEKMKILAAVLRDPNPIHWNRSELQRRGLGEQLINQGPANMGYLATMLARLTGGHDHLRRLTVRFIANVYEGDELTAGGVVTAVEEKDDVRLVECELWLDRQDGVRALSGTARLALPTRD